MSEIFLDNTVIISGNSNIELSEKITAKLNIKLCQRTLGMFSNTEIHGKIHENIRNKDVFLIQTGTFLSDMSYSINDYLMELLVMMDACKRSMARSINVIMPNYPYGRQDKKEGAREPISGKLVADLLQIAGATRLTVVDFHSPQSQGFFNIPVDNIFSVKLVIEYLNETVFKDLSLEEMQSTFILVSPDSGATKRTVAFAKRMNLNTVTMFKERDYTKTNCVEKMTLIGDKNSVKGRTALILDDMCDTAGTLIKAIRNLVEENGAKDVICVVTHGIFSGNAISRINKCKYITKIIVSDSIPQKINLEKCEKLEVFSISNLLSDVIKAILNGGSVSKLFR